MNWEKMKQEMDAWFNSPEDFISGLYQSPSEWKTKSSL